MQHEQRNSGGNEIFQVQAKNEFSGRKISNQFLDKNRSQTYQTYTSK